jgi:hypothetical protein
MLLSMFDSVSRLPPSSREYTLRPEPFEYPMRCLKRLGSIVLPDGWRLVVALVAVIALVPVFHAHPFGTTNDLGPLDAGKGICALCVAAHGGPVPDAPEIITPHLAAETFAELEAIPASRLIVTEAPSRAPPASV